MAKTSGSLFAVAFIAALLEWNVLALAEFRAIPMGLPGAVEPSSPIYRPIGGSANITCHIYREGHSSTIWFYVNDIKKEIKQPNENIIILNNTAAVLTLHDMQRQNINYDCMSGIHALGVVKVVVGTPPSPVENFSCRGYNFQNMTCSFRRLANTIYTNYSLSYTNERNKIDTKDCQPIKEEGDLIHCTLNSNRNSFYTALPETYYFNVTGENPLGTYSEIKEINNYNSIVPSKLEINLQKITDNSVTLTWDNYIYIYQLELELDYEFRIESKDYHGVYEMSENCTIKHSSFIIKDLPFAYYNYTLSVRVKMKKARQDDNMWSEAFVRTFRTLARLPDNPPKAALGSFYISYPSKLHLYWQPLKEYEYCGDKFRYFIYVTNLKGERVNSTYSYTSMVILDWYSNVTLNYNIQASNEIGNSKNFTRILVSKYEYDRQDYTPTVVENVYKNSSYVLSWKKPKSFEELLSYTIFWCLPKTEILNQCKGPINFTEINKDETSFTTEPQSDILNIAVSANYKNFSSGMQWASCTANENRDLIKLQPEISTTATTITLDWISENICSSIIKGYNITYCMINENLNFKPMHTSALEDYNSNCEMNFKTISGKQKKYTIDNLKPYTNYSVQIYMFSEKKKGPLSDAIIKKTKEAAPTPPQRVEFDTQTLTSSSVSISWDPPKTFNGHLNYYTIYTKKLQPVTNVQSLVALNAVRADNKNIDRLNFTLKNLESNTQYVVNIVANTTEKSKASKSMTFQTLIGSPPAPLDAIFDKRGNEGILKWNAPENPSGYLFAYEISMVIENEKNDTVVRRTYAAGDQCRFQLPDCNGHGFEIYMKMRAIYIANSTDVEYGILKVKSSKELTNFTLDSINEFTSDNDYSTYMFKCLNDAKIDVSKLKQKFLSSDKSIYQFASPWQIATNKHSFSCDSNVVYLSVVVVSVFIIVVAYYLRRKYQKMNSIEVVLPKGLVDQSQYTKNENYDEKIEREHSDISRSNDCLVNSKGQCRLLNGLRPNTTNAINNHPSVIADHNEHIKANSHENDNSFCNHKEEASTGSYYDEQASSQSTDSIDINDVSSFYSGYPIQSDVSDQYPSSSEHSQLMNKIQQINITQVSPANGCVSFSTLPVADSGYIAVDKVKNISLANTFDRSSSIEEELIKHDSTLSEGLTEKNFNNLSPVANNNNNIYVTPAELVELSRSELRH